jgi:hypothetical protein
MMLPRNAARCLALGCAVGTLLAVGCGGVNMADKDRRAPSGPAAAAADEDAAPAGELEQQEAGALPEVDAASSVADADAGTPPPEVVPAGSYAAGTDLDTTSNLHLRDGPGTEFAIIVEIPLGSRVKVQKTSGADGWVNIAYGANVGFSSTSFLKTVP